MSDFRRIITISCKTERGKVCDFGVVLNASIEGFVSILNENLVFNSHPTPSDFEIFRIVFNDLKIFQHILITDEKFDLSEYDILVDDKILDDFRMQICTFSDTFDLYVPLFCEMLHKQMDCNKYKRSFHFLRGTIIATLFTQFICSLSLINTFDLLIRSILQSDTIRFCRHLLKLPRCLKNFVIVCHNAISILLLEDVTNVRSDKIHSICLLLQDLSSLSSKTDIFIHEQLSSMLDCKNELNLYNEKKMFSFLYVPAVLTFEFRYKCYFMSNPMLPRRIRLDIRRDHFITDIRQLLNIPKDKLFNNDLNIFFLGESALDLGGVKREFFDLVGRTFGDLRHGLLKKISPEFYWFNDLDCYSDDESWYRILGMIIGMCIRQRTMISIKFPIILYKALLQKEITRIDLIEIYPELIKNLDKLAKFNNLEINELDLRFSVTTTNEMTNESKDIPLIENGCEIKVTEANVNQYVNEYFLYLVKNLLNKNYYSFYTGFKRIVGDNLCNWFSPEDIALMVSGDDDINWVFFKML
ncbi:hypothetical protein TRFO_19577 [Tritrichomonas foetus]|uniref:HECT-type E3 ubiquitin transferase n=1 Tax=Tritrichomonas foetus TaxID=1144522 RepID=A0A1J4KIS5_9EUKA|nr:hypothetical protein TRFO_19577 [Tritrichomonas foetus]|eukprot:OHT10986.1 hypothetical protein TRFO_19577 [Tritrichomonas foetus]